MKFGYCIECGEQLTCADCDPRKPRAPQKWAVVLRGVRFGSGQKKTVVIAVVEGKMAARSIEAEYRATGHDAKAMREEDVPPKAWTGEVKKKAAAR